MSGRKKTMDKPCEDCGRIMKGVYYNTKRCDECKEKERTRQYKKHNEARQKRNAKLRDYPEKHCSVCGKIFKPKKINSVTCSNEECKKKVARKSRYKKVAQRDIIPNVKIDDRIKPWMLVRGTISYSGKGTSFEGGAIC